jgi:hypothetical protein
MQPCYDWRALRRIAKAMQLKARPVDPGRVRYVLRHIEAQARTVLLRAGGEQTISVELEAVYREQGGLVERPPYEVRERMLVDYVASFEAHDHERHRRETRDRLRELANALALAAKLESNLPFGERMSLSVALGNKDRTVERYLGDLAQAAEQAASSLKVRSGPKANEALSRFIRQLADHVESFAGWTPGVSTDPYTGAHGGPFVRVVTACLEPLGIDPSNQALGSAIKRALATRGKLRA